MSTTNQANTTNHAFCNSTQNVAVAVLATWQDPAHVARPLATRYAMRGPKPLGLPKGKSAPDTDGRSTGRPARVRASIRRSYRGVA